MPRPDALVVDQVEERDASASPKVFRVRSGIDAGDGDGESDPVCRGDMSATPMLRESDVGLRFDEWPVRCRVGVEA